MAVISWEHRFLFIQTPRTGCSAIAHMVLIPQLGGENIPEKYIGDGSGNILVDKKHATLQQLLDHRLLSAEDASRLFKFSAVRNPFDSVFSEYVKQRASYQPLLDNPHSWVHKAPGYVESMRFAIEHSFEEWLDRAWRRPFPRSLKRRYGSAAGELAWQNGMDYVMRFERLQEDFDEVMTKLGLEPIAIPKYNETRERDSEYRSEYTRKARRIVERVYEDTLERFGYTF